MSTIQRCTRHGAGPTAAAILSAFATIPAALAQPAFPTATAVYESAPRERIWDGTIEAVNQATVSAQTSGRVAEIYYDVDDFVEAGAPIMRFTDTQQRAALQQAEAALQEATARLTEAQSEFNRISAMFENQTVPRARFEQAQANYEAATARVDAARSGVASAREQLDYTIVRAPYAGIVSQRHVEVGELVNPGQPLMSGLSLQRLRVNVDVPQSLIDPIREIGRAYAYVGDARIEAESLTFSPIADPVANTFRVRVELPEIAQPLYPGMFIKIGFVIGETQRLLVPADAVVRRSEVTAAYVVVGAEVALRQLRLGRPYGDRIEVLAGLEPGETIALDPVAAGVYVKERAAAGN
jgi:RND family efflux transporter MFP subunit